MKLDKWINKSRRITLHSACVGKSLIEKVEIIPKVVGRFNRNEWNKSDALYIKKLFCKLSASHVNMKSLSEVFFRELYNNKILYRKFVFFGSNPRMLGGFSRHVSAAIESRFCVICKEQFAYSKVCTCSNCGISHAKKVSDLKRAHISEKNKIAWKDPKRDICGKRAAKLMASEGITNGMQRPASIEKRRVTLQRKYGDNWQEKILSKVRSTNRKKYGTDYLLSNSSIRAKGQETLKRVYGEAYAMQIPKFFLKAMSKSRHIYEITLEGRKYKVQGLSAMEVLKRLVAKYGAKDISTEFSEDFPDYAFSEMRTFPDFYIHSLDTFIECKSPWTFMGRGKTDIGGRGEGDLKTNRRKAQIACDSGNKVRWIIHIKRKKQDAFLFLASNWYLEKPSSIRGCVNNFIQNILTN